MPEKRSPAIADMAVGEKITKGRAGTRWDNVFEKMEGVRGRPRKGTVYKKVWRVQDRSKITNRRERLTLRTKVEEEKHLEIYRGLREDIGMKTCLHGPMDYAKKLKLRFRVEDLDLPERRKRYTRSRVEEDVATHMCPCGTAIESRAHIIGECEVYERKRDALEKETRKLYVCDMEELEFGRLESSEKTIVILGDRYWPQTAKQNEDRISKQFLCNIYMEEA